ncbi:MAG: hypothetical protein ACTSXF_07110, partial [Promethearchaeota archaeon]
DLVNLMIMFCISQDLIKSKLKYKAQGERESGISNKRRSLYFIISLFECGLFTDLWYIYSLNI